MNIDRKVVEQALDALNKSQPIDSSSVIPHNAHCKAITSLRQALEQAEKERNFCSRCGKRLGTNDWDIHTCTPPAQQEPLTALQEN